MLYLKFKLHKLQKNPTETIYYALINASLHTQSKMKILLVL